MSAVSTEIVPFATMQRMATAVVKSRMFGLETDDQALALMLLCQAEGMHPMIGVRDYHFFKGKPSMKAETMLARFLEAGGKVKWHILTDEKVEATFTHPSTGETRIDWTIERAAKAGLTGKDNWKGYPRAMLRSRCVSEGVRTSCPAVTRNKYTPEEIDSMSPEIGPIEVSAAIDSFERPGVPQEQVDGLIRSISEAADEKALKTAYQEAHRVALEAKDERRIGSFAIAYDARKGELSAPQAVA